MRVQHRAEDVVLALVERAVADPHRVRALVAGELVARGLGQVAPAVDAVHDLQRAVGVGLEVGDELHELVGLPVEVEPVQRLQRERGVAHPRVAVVPVALAARRLRQRGRRGGDGRAGGHVGEALDRQRRALDRLAPAVVGEARPVEPLAPERRRRDDRGVGLVDVGRRRQLLRPGQRAVRPLALAQHVAGTRAVALDADRQVGLQADRRARRRSRRRPGGRRRRATTRRACGRSRTPARTRARARRSPRCTRPSARGGARRPRRPAAACAA